MKVVLCTIVWYIGLAFGSMTFYLQDYLLAFFTK